MKYFLITLSLLMLSLTDIKAKEYYEASIYLKDGTIKNGLAKIVETETDEYVSFKKNDKSEVERIEAIKVNNLVYTIEDKKYEYVFLKVYRGWKQEETRGPIWLEVVDKGVATLYVTTTVLYTRVGTPSQGSGTFHDYYIIRKGEPAAKIIATIATANNNQTFRAKAPLYFSDYPELATKIRNKEYTWKNLEEVVDIYNKWAENKNK